MFTSDIKKDVLENEEYRKVVYTSPGFLQDRKRANVLHENTTSRMQLVLMSLKVGETIPREVHDTTTQFIKVERGLGMAITEKNYGTLSAEVIKTKLAAGHVIIIPPGMPHEIRNIGQVPLKLYTIYVPPEHH